MLVTGPQLPDRPPGTATMDVWGDCRARSKRYEGSGIRPAKSSLPMHDHHPRTPPGEAVLSRFPRSLPLRRSKDRAPKTTATSPLFA